MSNHSSWLYNLCFSENRTSYFPNTQTALTAERWYELWMISLKCKDYHSPNQQQQYWEEEAWDKTLRLQSREKPGAPGFASWPLTAGLGNLSKNKLMQSQTSPQTPGVCPWESEELQIGCINYTQRHFSKNLSLCPRLLPKIRACLRVMLMHNWFISYSI